MSSRDSPSADTHAEAFSPPLTDAEDSDESGNVLTDRHNEPFESLSLSPVYAMSNAGDETLSIESISDDPGDDVFNSFSAQPVDRRSLNLMAQRFASVQGATTSYRFPTTPESDREIGNATFEGLENYDEKPPYGK
ncbi:hypothetical protein Ddc_06351 [Ditylenchus destructor]|nr:hypothetical protein Ddc_06351 [Ditylenchus destructor]